MCTRNYLLGGILLCFLSLYGQERGQVEFGAITPEERQVMKVPGDSSAEAYVLYDHRDLSFQYSEEQGPIRVETYHRRIKLLRPSSFDRANISVDCDRSFQDVSNFEATIHLPDGKDYRLKPEEFIRQQLGGNTEAVTFTFPQVMAGAIIEYTYRIRSASILIPRAYSFQDDIPVRLAEYTAMMPPFYKYVSLGSPGKYAVNDVKVVMEEWGPRYLGSEYFGGPRSPIEMTEIHWAMVDLPAYKYQPYSNNFSDYVPSVRLQLQAIQYPGKQPVQIFNNWQKTAEELNDRKDFGRYFRSRNNYKKVWKSAEATIADGQQTKERIDAAYRHIVSHIEWNGTYSFLASDSPNAIVEAGIGNSADLNISLLAMLNESGIEAYPLLVSLRDRGAPIEAYPILTQFDHLMVYTELDGKPYLLDANGKDRPPGLPRIDALNHRGWVADEKNPRWVDIEVPRARQAIMAEINVLESGESTVSLKGRLDSYFAFSAREQLAKMNVDGEGPLAAEVMAAFPEVADIKLQVLQGRDDARQPLTLELKCSVPAAMANDEYLYVQPVLLPMLNEELDDVEERFYPIDFPYPWQRNYVANITVPTGYVVDGLPEPVRLRSQDGGMSASYVAESKPDGTVFLVFSVDLDRTVYPAEDYGTLREFYHRIIELQSSPIVFKRAK